MPAKSPSGGVIEDGTVIHGKAHKVGHIGAAVDTVDAEAVIVLTVAEHLKTELITVLPDVRFAAIEILLIRSVGESIAERDDPVAGLYGFAGAARNAVLGKRRGAETQAQKKVQAERQRVFSRKYPPFSQQQAARAGSSVSTEVRSRCR